MRSVAARARRIAAGTLAALLIVAALVLGGLRLLVAQLPEHAGQVQAWVERQTHLRIEYRGLDARLRWFGPEVVLRDVRVLDEDGTQALFETREGSVGLDLWNFFRTGQLVAGRVRFLGPDITVVRLPDGRIRLLGQRERPADRPPFDLDRLPAGRVLIEDATVTYRDLKTGRGPWTLTDLQLTLRRDRDHVATEGNARLPARLGGRIEFNGRLRGSLDEFKDLQARIEVRARRVVLPGWSDFLPPSVARLQRGEGSVTAIVRLADATVHLARFDVDLADVALELPRREVPTVTTVEVSAPHAADESPMHLPVVDIATVERPAHALPRVARYARLSGSFRLRREGEVWLFRLQDLRTERNASRLQEGGRLDVRLRGNPVTTFNLGLDAERLRLAELWPLALAFAPRSFDRWSGLDPVGDVRTLRLDLRRTRAGALPEFALSADVDGLGVRPTGRVPGVRGLTAVLSGTDERGRIALSSGATALDWPRVFRAPIELTQATATVDWSREGSTWTLSSNAVNLRHASAQAEGSFEIRLPRRPESPVLTIAARVAATDAGITRQFLPANRLKPRTLAWLDRAFVSGQVRNGQFLYRGPVHSFPFRNGEGEFRASADLEGITLDYFAGFAPLTGAAGHVEFHNAGMTAQLQEGQIAGLRIRSGAYSVADFKKPLMQIDATGSGDLAKALPYLQGSPLGPTLGRFVMGLRGSGPADFVFAMTIPPAESSPGEQTAVDYRVRADLKAVTVQLPALRAPAENVTGRFELHNLEMRSPSLRGTLLGGPFDVSIAPGAVGGNVTAAIEFRGHGRAGGAPLPAFIGLPASIRMSGGAEWELKGRIERRTGLPDWPLRIDVASSLAGLGIIAPQPFAKVPAETRPTRVTLEVPSSGINDVAVESGSARARLRFTEAAGGKWNLERGLARFDGQPAVLPARPGLLVAGDWPQFDLGEWLAMRSGTGDGPQLSEWLGPVDVHLDRALVAGFELHDVTAHLGFAGKTWLIGLQGPMAEGEVRVPEDLATGQPIVLEMKRLVLEAPSPSPGSSSEPVDPRTLPALTVRAADLTWETRRLGSVQATITKVPTGLRFDSLASSAPSFTVTGQGSWLVEGAGSRTRVALDLESTDLAATSTALGYREAVEAKRTSLKATVDWEGGPSADAINRLNGKLHLALDNGQLLDVNPGAGRILGLMSVVELPRRLALDFRDVTEKGLAFDKVRGDFDLRDGNAYTQNLLLKGPVVDIGVIGRTGLGTEDYDQTLVVSGNPGGPLTVASFAAGPVVGASVLVLSQLFKGQLQGLTRAYYHVTGPWSNPVVQRVPAPAAEQAAQDNPAPQGGSQ